MSVSELVRSLADRLEQSANVRKVYGDPVSAEGRTIIPVARVGYGFGGGGGHHAGNGDDEGSGGGGGVGVSPIGVIEVTEGETRFIPFGQTRALLLAAAAGLCAGVLLGRRSRGH